MTTNIQPINLPTIVQIGWGHHVDFCVWKNRPLLLAKGVVLPLFKFVFVNFCWYNTLQFLNLCCFTTQFLRVSSYTGFKFILKYSIYIVENISNFTAKKHN